MRLCPLIVIQSVALAVVVTNGIGQEAALVKQLGWSEWKERCSALPSNQRIIAKTAISGRSAISAAQFDDLLDRYFTVELGGALTTESRWVGGKPSPEFYDASLCYFKDSSVPLVPFAQKLTLDSESTVVFHGDLHGDIRSLLVSIDSMQTRGLLDGFRVVDPSTHLVFLGDYTDRGYYGVEVIATLLRLKLENPGNVWLSRGNHEDFRLGREYGFAHELWQKFRTGYDMSKVFRLYDCLPVVIYVGSSSGDFLQCNHGGMEPGYAASQLLEASSPIAYQQIGRLTQATFAQTHPALLTAVDLPERNYLNALLRDFTPLAPTKPRTIGFLWNDFSVFPDDDALSYMEDRGWSYGEKATAVVLDAQSSKDVRVRAVFRAHQHSKVISPLMQRLLVSNGVFQHWQTADASGLATAPQALLGRLLETSATRKVSDGAVYTFNVSPDSIYGLNCYYNFVTHGVLSIAEKFSDWQLEVVAQPVADRLISP